MIVKPRGLVVMPKLPSTLGTILIWCKEVNRALQQLRDRPIVVTGGSSTRAVATSCPFGELITIPDTDPAETGIRGGVIYCGDQNWNMDPDPVSPVSDGEWLVSISIAMVANTDDAGEILLPGVETGTRPTGAWTRTTWTTGTDYPDNTAPVLPGGAGTIIIPIGKLTITGGVATLDPVACGNITVGHCAGTLSHARA